VLRTCASAGLVLCSSWPCSHPSLVNGPIYPLTARSMARRCSPFHLLSSHVNHALCWITMYCAWPWIVLVDVRASSTKCKKHCRSRADKLCQVLSAHRQTRNRAGVARRPRRLPTALLGRPQPRQNPPELLDAAEGASSDIQLAFPPPVVCSLSCQRFGHRLHPAHLCLLCCHLLACFVDCDVRQ
jgi:hypothetical protein